MSDFHACPVPMCARSVPNAKLMCVGHWRMVTPETQTRVNRLFRRSGETRELRLAQLQAVREAQGGALVRVVPGG